jgi:flagellar hook assembly protein FlgD
VWEAPLEDKDMKEGYHWIEWDCKNKDGEIVAAGVYIILLVADGEVATNKIAVIK